MERHDRARLKLGGYSCADPLGAGSAANVFAHSVYDDGAGNGPALHAGGLYSSAGSVQIQRIARWNGVQWSGIDDDLNDEVAALAVHAAGGERGSDLYVGGAFDVSTTGDSYLARYGGCAPAGLGNRYCFGDGSGSACPCGNAGGDGEGCANSSGAGAALTADGSVSVSTDDLAFSASGLLPGRPTLLFAGTATIGGGSGSPFGDGLRCAGGSVIRLAVAVADAGGNATWGPGLGALGSWSAGETRYFQVWYRDPNGPCSSAFNLTHGVELTFAP